MRQYSIQHLGNNLRPICIKKGRNYMAKNFQNTIKFFNENTYKVIKVYIYIYLKVEKTPFMSLILLCFSNTHCYVYFPFSVLSVCLFDFCVLLVFFFVLSVCICTLRAPFSGRYRLLRGSRSSPLTFRIYLTWLSLPSPNTYQIFLNVRAFSDSPLLKLTITSPFILNQLFLSFR